MDPVNTVKLGQSDPRDELLCPYSFTTWGVGRQRGWGSEKVATPSNHTTKTIAGQLWDYLQDLNVVPFTLNCISKKHCFK